jgi:hypothetical protein
LQHINASWTTVFSLLRKLVLARQDVFNLHNELGGEKIRDVFTKLVSATSEDAKYALSPEEVVRFGFEGKCSVPSPTSRAEICFLYFSLGTVRNAPTFQVLEPNIVVS